MNSKKTRAPVLQEPTKLNNLPFIISATNRQQLDKELVIFIKDTTISTQFTRHVVHTTFTLPYLHQNSKQFICL